MSGGPATLGTLLLLVAGTPPRADPAGDPRASGAAADLLAPILEVGALAIPIPSPDSSLAFLLAREEARGDEAVPSLRLMITGLADGSFASLGLPDSPWADHDPPQRLVGLRLLREEGELSCGWALLEPALVGDRLAFAGVRELSLAPAEDEPRACGAILPAAARPTAPTAAPSAAAVPAPAGNEPWDLPSTWRREIAVRPAGARGARGDGGEGWIESTVLRLGRQGPEPVGEAERRPASGGPAPWLHLRVSAAGDEELIQGPWERQANDEWPGLAAIRAEHPDFRPLRISRSGELIVLEAQPVDAELADEIVAILQRGVDVEESLRRPGAQGGGWLSVSYRERDGGF